MGVSPNMGMVYRLRKGDGSEAKHGYGIQTEKGGWELGQTWVWYTG